jgi:hypothetical protein
MEIISINNADNSRQSVFSEQHHSPESQQNPNTSLDSFDSVGIIDHDRNSTEYDETLRSVYAFLLSNFNLIHIFLH